MKFFAYPVFTLAAIVIGFGACGVDSPLESADGIESLEVAQADFAGASMFSDQIRVVATRDDPDVDPDLSVCAEAPFTPNVLLGASVWSLRVKKKNAVVKPLFRKQIGTGTACVQIVDPTFPLFTPMPFYGSFVTPGETLKVSGQCYATSNDVPVAGLVLVSCATTVVDGPPEVLGGIVTSNSVFNPSGLPGFETGSVWTLRTYELD